MLKATVLVLSIYGLGGCSGRVLKAELDQCTPKCDSICQQCLQSAPREVISCLDTTLLEGCTSQVMLTESWNITHYCVATDSNLGGWGFLTPVVRDIIPEDIVYAEFKADLVPTTGPYDVLQDSEIAVTVSLEADKATSTQQSIVHTCAIERYDGITGTMSADPIETDKPCSNGTEPDEKMGCEFQARHVNMNITTPFTGTSPITKSQVLFAILADSKQLSNNGILPPALENAVLTVKHKATSGSSGSTSTEF